MEPSSSADNARRVGYNAVVIALEYASYFKDNAWWIFGSGGIGTVVIAAALKWLLTRSKKPRSDGQATSSISSVKLEKGASASAVSSQSVSHVNVGNVGGDAIIGNTVTVIKEESRTAKPSSAHSYAKVETIFAELDDVPPLQRKSLRLAYRGQWVKGAFMFIDAEEVKDNQARVHALCGAHLIIFTVSLLEHPELKTLRARTSIEVSGKVDSVDGILILNEVVFSVLAPVSATDGPAPEPAKPLEKPSRILMNMSLTDMMSSVKGLISYDAERLVESKYKNKCVRVVGLLDDMVKYGGGLGGELVCSCKLHASDVIPRLHAHFPIWWEQRLSHLRKGDSIHLTGVVHSVSTVSVHLEDCEIVDADASAMMETADRATTDALEGKWQVHGKRIDGQIGWEGWFTFYADGTALVEDKLGGGRANGKWIIQGDTIRVNWDRVESGTAVWDEFELPIRPDGIAGRSWGGGTTHATKL
jgi:hypothetical protein